MDEHAALAETAAPPAGPAESDGVLLSRYARARDEPAFAELVARHGGMVYALCRRRLPCSADVDDVFQAAFLALAMQADRLDGSRSLAPWLYRVTWRMCRQVLRGDRRRRWSFGFAFENVPDKKQQESTVDLDAALASLAESERAAIVLCHLEGLSRAEAAKQLGIPEGTLSARLSRGLEKLRRRLGRSPLALLVVPLVAAPQHLQAAVMDSVRQLPNGSLEAFASTRTLELAKGESQMRWLSRLGPLAAALVLMVVMLTAAWGVMKSLAQEPKAKVGADAPAKADKPREITKAVAAMQKAATAQARIDPKKATDPYAYLIVREVSPREALPYLTFELNELRGPKNRIIHNGKGWLALELSLRRLAKRQCKRIGVQISFPNVSRLEANQIVNECKRAGFEQLAYRGPKLASDVASGNKAQEPSGNQVFNLDLTKVSDELPDWTNGWCELEGKIVSAKAIGSPMAMKCALSLGGKWGPGHRLAADSSVHADRSATVKMSEAIASSVGEKRSAGVSILLSLDNAMTPFLEIDETMQYGQLTSRHQDLDRATEALADSLEHTKSHGAKIVLNLQHHPRELFFAMFDPLFVNGLINHYKRQGVKSLNYSGPPIFTGETEAGDATGSDYAASDATVEIALDLQSLTGELPDATNGWEFIPRKGPRKRETAGGNPRQ